MTGLRPTPRRNRACVSGLTRPQCGIVPARAASCARRRRSVCGAGTLPVRSRSRPGLYRWRRHMGRGLLLWLIGIPIPIILLIWLFGGLS
jgi:hypothetical protein